MDNGKNGGSSAEQPVASSSSGGSARREPVTLMDTIVEKAMSDKVLGMVNEHMTARNYSEVGNLARQGQMGPAAYMFCSVVDKIAEANTLRAAGDAQTKILMGTFMNAVIESNNKIIENYHQIRRIREETKKSVDTTFRELMAPLAKTLADASATLLTGACDKETFNLIKETINEMRADIKEHRKDMLDSLGLSREEDEMLERIQDANDLMIKNLTEAMIKITESSASSLKVLADSLGSIMIAKLTHAGVNNDEKKGKDPQQEGKISEMPPEKLPPKKMAAPSVFTKDRKYEFFKARGDFNPTEEQLTSCEGKKRKPIAFKAGETIKVYNQNPKSYKGWYKAEIDRPQEEHTVTHSGVVPPSYLKAIK